MAANLAAKELEVRRSRNVHSRAELHRVRFTQVQAAKTLATAAVAEAKRRWIAEAKQSTKEQAIKVRQLL